MKNNFKDYLDSSVAILNETNSDILNYLNMNADQKPS